MQRVESRMIARQRGREIESKSVNVHLQHPVTQTVGHQLERAWMNQIESVAGAGEIEIEPRILRMQPVVGEIVDPAEAQRRPEMISFPCVIVNHVENHLDARCMQAAHHSLELSDLLAHLPAAGVLPMWSEKPDCIVAPVVR